MTIDDRRRPAAAASAALLGLAALAACAPPVPDRLYTLLPAGGAASAAGPGGQGSPVVAATPGPVVGLDPVTLPAYLDRPEIVTRSGAHQVRLGEFDKWVEPLQPMFRRLLEERLRRATGAREVVPLPAPDGVDPRHAVGIEVGRFDADEAGRVLLDARWRIYQVRDGRTVAAGRELIQEAGAPPPDYPAVVAAMGRAVDKLAAIVAPAVPGARPQ